jgi:hypothetical protein
MELNIFLTIVVALGPMINSILKMYLLSYYKRSLGSMSLSEIVPNGASIYRDM